jgi:hypothetical protein
MSELVENEKLDVIETIKEGVDIGLKNVLPILVNLVLWVLTCWIPYLNVGTTIGLFVGIVSKVSRGETIPMTEIFDPKYRKYMGEFFLTYGLLMTGIIVGYIFLIIPGIVIAIAWSLSLLLLIDKGKNPIEAITLSNSCTYGNKWRMLGVYILPAIAMWILMVIFALIPKVGSLLTFLLMLVWMFVVIGLQASIYKRLTERVRSGE